MRKDHPDEARLQPLSEIIANASRHTKTSATDVELIAVLLELAADLLVNFDKFNQFSNEIAMAPRKGDPVVTIQTFADGSLKRLAEVRDLIDRIKNLASAAPHSHQHRVIEAIGHMGRICDYIDRKIHAWSTLAPVMSRNSGTWYPVDTDWTKALDRESVLSVADSVRYIDALTNGQGNDGPHDPDRFDHGGKSATIRGKGFHLLKCVWNSPARSVSEQDVIDSVWGTDARADNSLSPMISRTNDVLYKAGIKICLRRRNGFVTID